MGPGRSQHKGVWMIRSKGLELGWSKWGVGLVKGIGWSDRGVGVVDQIRGLGWSDWVNQWSYCRVVGQESDHINQVEGVMGSRVKSQIDGLSSASGTIYYVHHWISLVFKLARPVACFVCQFFPVTWAFLSAEELELSAVINILSERRYTSYPTSLTNSGNIGFHTDVIS